MSRQRLTDAAKFTGGGGGSGGDGPMEPGDVRIVEVKDRNGQVTKTITIHRTDRAYVYDLCDAYNAARTRQDIEWYVSAAGELKLGEPGDWTRNHTDHLARKAERDRQEWIRNNRPREWE